MVKRTPKCEIRRLSSIAYHWTRQVYGRLVKVET